MSKDKIQEEFEQWAISVKGNNILAESIRRCDTADHGVVSLFDMMEFYAHVYLEMAVKLAAWEKVAGEDDRDKLGKPEYTAMLFAEVSTFGLLSLSQGFNSTSQQCTRIAERLKNSGMRVTLGSVRDDLFELRTRIQDDWKAEKFFHLSMKEADLYTHPARGWEVVFNRFPKTRIDIEESSKCFAFGRYAAALFHVLLVAEYGVVDLARLLNVAGDKPGWGAMERLEKISAKPYKEKSELEKKYSSVLDGIMPFALSIKNQWRHKISHVENKLVWVDTDFSPRLAEDIIGAVRAFMDKLASDLPK